jgi:hypothetical protein
MKRVSCFAAGCTPHVLEKDLEDRNGLRRPFQSLAPVSGLRCGHNIPCLVFSVKVVQSAGKEPMGSLLRLTTAGQWLFTVSCRYRSAAPAGFAIRRDNGQSSSELVLFHISNLDFFHRSESRLRDD